MKKKLLLLTLALGALVPIVSAQSSGDQYVSIRSIEKSKNGDMINIKFDVDHENLALVSQQELIVTPIIINGRDTTDLSSVVFTGRKRYKVNSRKERLYGYDPYGKDAYLTMMVKRNSREIVENNSTRGSSVVAGDLITYEYRTAYQPWMRGSQVALKQELRGCNDMSDTSYTALGPLYDPVMPRLLYITPEPAPERRRETMSAQIIFRQDKYDIRRDLGRNGAELDRMYDMTERISNDAANNVKALNLRGVASPEGTYRHNTGLSRNRAVAVRNHLRDKYSLDDRMFEISNTPEDWDSVRVWVAASSLQHRDAVVKIINDTSDPDARDAKIRSLDGGRTYREIYNRLYPGLRRVEYSIDYEVGLMPVDVARRTMNSNPASMSAQEMYVVLRSYPADSPDAARVLATLVAHYPNDVIANNNLAAIALKKGDRDTARRYLERISDNADALNNLGVLYALDGMYEKAASTFRMAAANGSSEAVFNLENLYSLE